MDAFQSSFLLPLAERLRSGCYDQCRDSHQVHRILGSAVNPRGILVGGDSDIQTQVGLDIWELWDTPNTSPAPGLNQVIFLPDVDASVLIDFVPVVLDEIASAFLNRVDNPKHERFFTIPRNGSVLFEPYIAFDVFQAKLELLGDIQRVESEADFEFCIRFFSRLSLRPSRSNRPPGYDLIAEGRRSSGFLANH